MEDICPDNITIDKAELPLFVLKELQVSVLRLDKLHPLISGNKWFKLRFYLEEAKRSGKKKILTYGGAWSNHIIATAAVCQLNGLEAIGIIRGEEPRELSDTLLQAKQLGMRLVFISRDDYAGKEIPASIRSEDYCLIPEGGFGNPGVKGAATITDYFKREDYTHICCAVGTGTMLAGLISKAQSSQQVLGISVLKNNRDLERNVKKLLNNTTTSPRIIHDYHCGGYARYHSALIGFMNEFYRHSSIPSDFVYTGKLFFGISDLAKNNYFPARSKLLLIHSGGLQGNASLGKGTLIF